MNFRIDWESSLCLHQAIRVPWSRKRSIDKVDRISNIPEIATSLQTRAAYTADGGAHHAALTP